MTSRQLCDAWLVIGSAILSIVVVGCGANEGSFERYPISGSVSLDGEPLSDAAILLVPMANVKGPKVLLPIVDGQFSADASHGPVLGSHRVEIVLTDNPQYAHDDEEKWKELQTKRVRVARPEALPLIYNEQSVLKAEIGKPAGESPQRLTFELKSR
jgi:hypothetical protein